MVHCNGVCTLARLEKLKIQKSCQFIHRGSLMVYPVHCYEFKMQSSVRSLYILFFLSVCSICFSMSGPF